MRRRRWSLSVPASLALHGAGLFLIIALFPRAAQLPPLLVDLTEVVRVSESADQSVKRSEAPAPASPRAASSQLGRHRRAEREGEEARHAPPLLPAEAPRSSPPAPLLAEPAPSQPGPALATPAEPRPSTTGTPVATPPEPERSSPPIVTSPPPAPRADAQAAPVPAHRVERERRVRTEPPGDSGVATRVAAEPSATSPAGDALTRGTDERTGGAISAGRQSGVEAGTEQIATGGAARQSSTSSDGQGPAVAAGPGGGRTDAAAGGGSKGPLALAVPGGGQGGVGAEYGPYLGALRRRIQESVRYPLAARRRGLAGSVHVEVVIEPNGKIGAVSILQSSTHPLLDEAAVEAVRNLPPLPFPPELPPRALRVRLPVVFELR